MVSNERVAYYQHVLFDALIELWHMIIGFAWMLLILRLYHIQNVYMTIRK